MTVFFHGNFGLDRPRMAKLAGMASENPERDDADLAKEFGYGAPFAATYRSWLHKGGIARRGRPFRLTDFGQVVLKHDPDFLSPVTMWFLHHELTIDPERAEAWHFFVYEFRPKHPRFTKDVLQMGLMEKLRGHSEKHFGESSKMNPIIVRKLLECYTAPSALGELGILKSTCNASFEFTEAEQLGPWALPNELAEAYGSIK